ncbi:hypothetical protein niasHS_014194 [Heterodera schachtii]|uniref:Lon proteolytic domain-containing protein n=2 Tax=Heterodera TaxID=34509 RepID=A0ABD2I2L9_HETSC
MAISRAYFMARQICQNEEFFLRHNIMIGVNPDITVTGNSIGAAAMLSIVSLAKQRPARFDSIVTGAVEHNGDIEGVGEIIPKVEGAVQHGLQRIIIPMLNGQEVADMAGIEIVPIVGCQEVVDEMMC